MSTANHEFNDWVKMNSMHFPLILISATTTKTQASYTAQKPDIYRCIRSNAKNRLSFFYAAIQIIFDTVYFRKSQK